MKFHKFSWVQRTIVLLAAFFVGFYWLQSYSSGLDDEVQSRIQEKAANASSLKLGIAGETIHSPEQLQKIYKSNSYVSFWSAGSTLSGQGNILQLIVEKAIADGLDPAVYHSMLLKQWVKSLNNGIGKENADSLAAFDILMTDAFVTYSLNQYAGVVYGNGMNVSRNEHVKKISLKDSLLSAIQENRIEEVLFGFVNQTPPYIKLKQSLQLYRRIAQKDGFETIPLLNRDSSNSEEVYAKLCKRLSLTEGLPKGYISSAYTPYMQVAVRKFQHSHGLDTTAALTTETIDQLNIPIEERIRQIELNMERLRWLPVKPQDKFIQVNIPGFFMEVKENYTTRLHMRAIVGKEYTQTPLFYANMSYLVINPYWDVPFSIATKEMLPILKRDPGYLSRSHMVVYNAGGAELNPYAVSWGAYSTKYFPLHIRQLPGSWNSLGDIKFMFPNPYSVYLHGTPHQELFEQSVRAFSHGCMRLEDPVAFAVYLLQDQKQWDEVHIREKIATRQETTVKLTHKLPVFVTYATCWVDDDNVLQFRSDVYGHDNILARELFGENAGLAMR